MHGADFIGLPSLKGLLTMWIWLGDFTLEFLIAKSAVCVIVVL